MDTSLQDIQQKIGRNLLMFQDIEALLKHLVVRNNISGYFSDLASHLEQRVSSVEKQTMGALSRQFGETALSEDTVNNEPEELTGIWATWNFKFQDNELKASLEDLVRERNEFVHHFQTKMDLKTPSGINNAAIYLNQQYEKAQPICERLRTLTHAVELSGHLLDAFWKSDVGKKYLDIWYGRGARIMELLCNTAQEKARPDGWTLLSIARGLIDQQAPEELTALKEAYGKDTLKEILQVIEWVEIVEEPTSEGDIHVLYRMESEMDWLLGDNATTVSASSS